MCGGNYPQFEKKKQLLKVNGEVLVERTIRLLRENGIQNIAICTNTNDFDYLGLPILMQHNDYFYQNKDENKKSSACWLNAYFPIDQPCCYLHGDVYFSEEAIKTIIETPVEYTMFFCTCDGTDMKRKPYNWKGREPFAYKVENQEVFKYAIKKLMKMVDNGEFTGFAPISWHLYRMLNGYDVKREEHQDYTNINNIFQGKGDYVLIDDYTTDVDNEWDIERIEESVKEYLLLQKNM